MQTDIRRAPQFAGELAFDGGDKKLRESVGAVRRRLKMQGGLNLFLAAACRFQWFGNRHSSFYPGSR